MVRKIASFTEYEIRPFYSDIEDLGDDYYDENLDKPKAGIWNDFERISQTIASVDLEDTFIQYLVIFKQISTGEYYLGKWTDYYNDEPYYNHVLTQVFPVEKTITVYE